MQWALTSRPKSQWFTLDNLDEIDPELRPPLIYLRATPLFALPGSPVERQCAHRIACETEDNLNVAYVAFTRAVRELHIAMLPCSDEAGSLRTAIGDISGVAAPKGELYIDLAAHTDDLGNLTIGAPTQAGPAREPAPTLAGPDYAISFTKLNCRLTRLDDLTTAGDMLDPDIGNMGADPAIVDSGDTAQLREAARNGINMHSILSRMSTADDLDAAIAAEARNLHI